MVSLDEAKRLVEARLAAMPGHEKLSIATVAAYDFGWVIGYTSGGSVENPGNAPFLVERETGRVFETGTAGPIDAYISSYRATGDPNGYLTSSVLIAGCDEGYDLLAATLCLRRCVAGLGLQDARKIIQSAREGSTSTVETDAIEIARSLVHDLATCGVRAVQHAVLPTAPSPSL